MVPFVYGEVLGRVYLAKCATWIAFCRAHGVQGLGFRVQHSVIRVFGSRFRVRVYGIGVRTLNPEPLTVFGPRVRAQSLSLCLILGDPLVQGYLAH